MLTKAFTPDTASLIREGLEQLASGRCNDAVQLLLSEELPTAAQIQQLNLYGISSIKRDKNGGMEIHFFDRLKAFAALYELDHAQDSTAAAENLLTALAGGREENHDL